jgi:large subunit ribosomal protein L15e
MRLKKPTRTEKARKLGYKAKPGFIIFRARVRRGGQKKPVPGGNTSGKPKRHAINQLKYSKSKKTIAEERVGRLCGNLRVLNSYWINQDGEYKYFEVILVDPFCNSIRRDPRLSWICNSKHKHRETRGLTSSGKRSRGLRRKGHKANKIRPSRHSVWKRNNTKILRRFR